MPKFSVDTHLFRELGELLVGRDSTALVELVKNAYDADATTVTVYGTQLQDSEHGYIRIVDDGVGMDDQRFQQGFLTIASRSKEQGARESPRFRRRFTGAKGIGRLAAHKLAKKLQIDSISFVCSAESTRSGLRAVIDWDLIESVETIDQLEGTDAIRMETFQPTSTAISGTTITLAHLRRSWTLPERSRFITEVQSFEPPRILLDRLPSSIVSSPLLFEVPKIRDASAKDHTFRVSLEGEFASGDEYWAALLGSASWVIEIDADAHSGRVRYAIAPTNRRIEEYAELGQATFETEHPDGWLGPFFQARILIREGPLLGQNVSRSWASRVSGVRVFMEGFRVLPYGEPGNDWLSVDAEYSLRGRSLDLPLELTDALPSVDRNVGLNRLRNNSFFGAIFLTEASSPALHLLVNREGFVPNAGLENLTNIVRTGIALSTRIRAAATLQARVARGRKKGGADHDTPVQLLGKVAAEVVSLVAEARNLASVGDLDQAGESLAVAASKIRDASRAVESLSSEAVLLRVLASAGTQLAAFIHEINGLLATTEAIDRDMVRIRATASSPSVRSSDLARLHGVIADLRRSLERQSAYLVDVVTVDVRRRRGRQLLVDSFEAATRLVRSAADRIGVNIENHIAPDLRSPRMFPAELAAIFTNLLTNAVKAAGSGGTVSAWGSRDEDHITRIVVENTGDSIDLSHAERWFRPFESTTSGVDLVLGQGLGMGLFITRSILEEYGAEIHFISPRPGFATAVEVAFRG